MSRFIDSVVSNMRVMDLPMGVSLPTGNPDTDPPGWDGGDVAFCTVSRGRVQVELNDKVKCWPKS